MWQSINWVVIWLAPWRLPRISRINIKHINYIQHDVFDINNQPIISNCTTVSCLKVFLLRPRPQLDNSCFNSQPSPACFVSEPCALQRVWGRSVRDTADQLNDGSEETGTGSGCGEETKGWCSCGVDEITWWYTISIGWCPWYGWIICVACAHCGCAWFHRVVEVPTTDGTGEGATHGKHGATGYGAGAMLLQGSLREKMDFSKAWEGNMKNHNPPQTPTPRKKRNGAD